MLLSTFPLFLGIIPLLLIFVAGLFLKSVPGRRVHHWPPIITLQNIDARFIDYGMGRAGRLLTELISGFAHASLFFGCATAIESLTALRWNIAFMFFSFWIVFGMKRFSHRPTYVD